MRLLIDLLPWLFFAVTFWVTADIISATIVLIPAIVLQIVLLWLFTRTFEKLHLITLAAVIIFGGATIAFQESRFIQWKPTVINCLFALVFWVSHVIGNKKPLLQKLLAAKLQLPDFAWLKLSYAWIVFFLFSAAINLYVAYMFDESFWVNFKLFGQMAITIVFVLGQSIYIAKVMPQKDTHAVRDNK